MTEFWLSEEQFARLGPLLPTGMGARGSMPGGRCADAAAELMLDSTWGTAHRLAASKRGLTPPP